MSMHVRTSQFIDQLTDATDRYMQIDLKPARPVHQILCLGMGGSGIAGSWIKSVLQDTLTVPYETCKDYTIPARVGPHTLVIAASHSGNTEETIAALQASHQAGAQIVIITSGGALLADAQAHAHQLISLPDGMMPRACYTYAIVAQLGLLSSYGLISPDLASQLNNKLTATISYLRTHEQSLKQRASDIASSVSGRIPWIYTDSLLAPIGTRFAQQLNENGKILAHVSVIPEMNHNECLGRGDQYPAVMPIFLRYSFEHPRNALRIRLTQEIIKPHVTDITEIQAIGEDLFQQVFYLIYLTDRVSVYLSDVRGVDPTEIQVINDLKGELAKQ